MGALLINHWLFAVSFLDQRWWFFLFNIFLILQKNVCERERWSILLQWRTTTKNKSNVNLTLKTSIFSYSLDSRLSLLLLLFDISSFFRDITFLTSCDPLKVDIDWVSHQHHLDYHHYDRCSATVIMKLFHSIFRLDLIAISFCFGRRNAGVFSQLVVRWATRIQKYNIFSTIKDAIGILIWFPLYFLKEVKA